MNLKGCMSHNTDNWKTPSILLNTLKEHGWIDTFPYMADYDELQKNYWDSKLFVNPPYSKLREVSKWIIDQVRRKCLVLLLIPARTDTKYFHELLKLNPLIFFIQGRLKFNDVNTSAPFPSIIMYFDRAGEWPLWTGVTLEQFIERIILIK